MFWSTGPLGRIDTGYEGDSAVVYGAFEGIPGPVFMGD